MKIPVTITGVNFVKELTSNIMDSIEFEPEVSDEYKRGFCDFGHALIATLEKLQNGEMNEMEYGVI